MSPSASARLVGALQHEGLSYCIHQALDTQAACYSDQSIVCFDVFTGFADNKKNEEALSFKLQCAPTHTLTYFALFQKSSQFSEKY